MEKDATLAEVIKALTPPAQISLASGDLGPKSIYRLVGVKLALN